MQHHAGMRKREVKDAATVGRKLEGSRKYISVQGSSVTLGARQGIRRNVLL